MDTVSLLDECEEGELKRSPSTPTKPSPNKPPSRKLVKEDQLREMVSSEEDDTQDSLEIKPPQAQRLVVHSRIRKTTRKESNRRVSHKDQHRKEKRTQHDTRPYGRSKHQPREQKREIYQSRHIELSDDWEKGHVVEDLREKLGRRERRSEGTKIDKREKETTVPRKERKTEDEMVREKLEKQEKERRRERFIQADRQKESYRRDLEYRRQQQQRQLEQLQENERYKQEVNHIVSPPIIKHFGRRSQPEMIIIKDDDEIVEKEDKKKRKRASSEEAEESEENEEPTTKHQLIMEDVNSEEENSSTQSEKSEHSSEHEDEHTEESDSEGHESEKTDEDDTGDEVEEVREENEEKKENNESDIKVQIEERESSDDDLPPYIPAIQGCRSVEEFQCLNRIEEGTYGVVYRARDKRTMEIVALKRLKMEKEKEGFPITSLREINTLLKAQHSNIVTVREIVVGSNMDKIFIVMDYVEHDLKSLMETMKQKKQVFLPGEVKCLLHQLLRAVTHLHDNWILHRDLKTSNLLLSHKGILKVGDFGLAREYGSPLRPYTPIVVTLWYRAPELLLGIKEYSTHIDMWSVGCIFGELLCMEAMFPGKSEMDQLNRIFKDLGTPNEGVWTGYSKLPNVHKVTFVEYPVNQLRNRFGVTMLSDLGLEMINKFLTYNPVARVSAEDALTHEYFNEAPLPVDPSMFPTWPAKSELGHRKMASSPKPPSGGKAYQQRGDTDEFVGAGGFHMGTVDKHSRTNFGAGFSLKF